MFLSDYFTQSDDNFVFSKQQGSDFAKRIAGDFNPLHDPDNKRFCIPGDLLFSLTLNQFGVSQSMNFDFQGMIAGDMPVHFESTENQIKVLNESDKTLLEVSRSGETTQSDLFVESLTRSYVAFSGKTFPHIIVELMKQEGVMINAEKPMVIYDQMSLSFSEFSGGAAEVRLDSSRFEVSGKRGMVIMQFDICADDKVIGKGEKQIIMSGLRPYEQSGIDLLVDNYDKSRAAFATQQNN